MPDDFVLLVQASLVRSPESDESIERIQWFPVVQGVPTDFPSEGKSQGTQTFHAKPIWCHLQTPFRAKCSHLKAFTSSTPFLFVLASFGQVPPRFFAHCVTTTIRPRKINLSTSDVLYTSLTSGPAPVLIQRRDFRRRKPSVAVARESNLRRTKTQTPAGKTRAAVI